MHIALHIHGKGSRKRPQAEHPGLPVTCAKLTAMSGPKPHLSKKGCISGEPKELNLASITDGFLRCERIELHPPPPWLEILPPRIGKMMERVAPACWLLALRTLELRGALQTMCICRRATRTLAVISWAGDTPCFDSIFGNHASFAIYLVQHLTTMMPLAVSSSSSSMSIGMAARFLGSRD